ncbi:MAG: hypothetical protein RR929_00150 [Erysipelotrichaceae bacterium]
MSKKYILVVKDENYGYTYFPKPIDKTQIVNFNRVHYKTERLRSSINNVPSLLTQEEINELPHGFVKMFNIVEVEATKYYWRKKQEHLCSFEDLNHCYLNVWIIDNEPTLSSTKEFQYCKTKFTETEAKELLDDDFEMFERVDIE